MIALNQIKLLLLKKKPIGWHWVAHMKQAVNMLIFTGTDSILTVSHNIYCGKVHDQERVRVIYQILILILQQPEHPLNWLLKQPLWKIQLSITVLFGKTQWYKVYEKLYKNTPTLNSKISKFSQNQNVLSAITITVRGNTCNWYSSSQNQDINRFNKQQFVLWIQKCWNAEHIQIQILL